MGYFITSCHGQGYPVSKALAEKAAWEFAKDTNLDLVTIVPVLVSGPALTPEIPSSVLLSLSPLIAAGKTPSMTAPS